MAITQGKLTYDAEGTEGGRFHSRKLSVPSSSSGLTIGRGFDMEEKTCSQIETHMKESGVDGDHAKVLSKAAGLKGNGAKEFITANNLEDFEITMETQEKLFKVIYGEMSKDVRRICDKSDCVAVYGAVDWDNLDTKIKDVLVDLRYRGDYSPKSRKLIQKLVANNDLEEFKKILSDRTHWEHVPQDRFNRRVKFLD